MQYDILQEYKRFLEILEGTNRKNKINLGVM